MREADYKALQDGELIDQMVESGGWSLFCERFEQIKEGLLARMVEGVDDFTAYREIVGAWRTLGDIERIVGEYVERANQVKENLDNDDHG